MVLVLWSFFIFFLFFYLSGFGALGLSWRWELLSTRRLWVWWVGILLLVSLPTVSLVGKDWTGRTRLSLRVPCRLWVAVIHFFRVLSIFSGFLERVLSCLPGPLLYDYDARMRMRMRY